MKFFQPYPLFSIMIILCILWGLGYRLHPLIQKSSHFNTTILNFQTTIKKNTTALRESTTLQKNLEPSKESNRPDYKKTWLLITLQKKARSLNKSILLYKTLILTIIFVILIAALTQTYTHFLKPMVRLYFKVKNIIKPYERRQHLITSEKRPTNPHPLIPIKAIMNKDHPGIKSTEALKSDFISMVTHELRTPLTSIKGSLALLRSGVIEQFKLNNPTKTFVKIAEGESDRLIDLVNEVLDLSKIEAGQFALDKRWQMIEPIINSTFENIKGLAQTANVEIVYNPIPEVEVHADKSRVQQIITNLLSNAIKFSPTKSPIIIRCHLVQEQVIIEVQDRGKGIHEEDQGIIFEKFMQSARADHNPVCGTGLGLSIAKAITEEHGGQIGLYSRIGNGSSFFFTIPNWRIPEWNSKFTQKRKYRLPKVYIPTEYPKKRIQPLFKEEITLGPIY